MSSMPRVEQAQLAERLIHGPQGETPMTGLSP